MKLTSILIICLIALFVQNSFGATITWNTTQAGNTGNWNVASNWNGGALPGTGDTVMLGAGLTISITSSVSVGNLTMGTSTLIVTTGGSLTVTQDFTPGGTLRVDPGITFAIQGYLILAQTTYHIDIYNDVVTNAVQVNTVFDENTVFQNAGSGRFTFAGNQLPHRINANFFASNEFFSFSSTNQQTFVNQVGGTTTVTWPQTKTFGRIFLNNDLGNGLVGFDIQQGATLNDRFDVTNTTQTTRPGVIFRGIITVGTANLPLDVVPTFANSDGISTITINSNTLSFTNKAPTFTGVSQIQGTGGLNFVYDQAGRLTANFNGAPGGRVFVSIPTFTFTGRWQFSGNTVLYSNAVTINQDYIFANSVAFLQGLTVNSGATLVAGSGLGNFAIFNSVNFGASFTLDFKPTFNCTSGSFASNGQSNIILNNGLFVGPCSVTAQGTYDINGQLTVFGNATIPSQFNLNLTTAFDINSALTPPANSLWGLVINGARTVPNNAAFTVNDIEATFNALLTLNINASLGGNGIFSVTTNGGLTISGTGVVIGALVAFPPGSFSVSASQNVDWDTRILLRNTQLTGTANINYRAATILILNGVNQISTSNFVLAGGLSVDYLSNQVDVASDNATLIFNSGTTRTLKGAVGANNGQGFVTIIFDEDLSINGTMTFAGGANSAIVYRKGSTPYTFNLVTNTVLGFGTNVFFNNTDVRFTGIGSVSIGAGTIYVQGSWNHPAGAFVPVRFTGDNTIALVSTSVNFGENVLLEGNVVLDDLDGNVNTASKTLVMNTANGGSRTVQASITLGASITFTQNVIFTSTQTFDGPGTFTIGGNSIVLQASVTFNSALSLAGATTITSTSGVARTITVTERANNAPHGFVVPGQLTLGDGVTLAFSGNGNNALTVTLNAGGIGGTGTLTTAQTVTFQNAQTGTVTFNPTTVVLGGSTVFSGSAFNLSPSDGNLVTTANEIFGTATVTYTGAIFNVNAASTIPATFNFGANVQLNGGNTLTFEGQRVISTAFVLSPGNNIVFLDSVTLAAGTSFASLTTNQPTISFNKNVLLSTAITISLPVVFGVNPNVAITVTSPGFGLTLTSSSVTVSGAVVSGGSTITSNKPGLPLQTIAGAGVLPAEWTFGTAVEFTGNVNISGTRDINFAHKVSASIIFLDGINFPSAVSFVGGGTITIEGGVSTSAAGNTFISTLTVRNTGSKPFTYSGAGTLFINGTYTCATSITFASNVIFGWITPTTFADVNFNDKCQWSNPSSGPATVQLYRTNLINNQAAPTTDIGPNIVFPLLDQGVTVSGSPTTLRFAGSVTVSAPKPLVYNFNGAHFVNSTIISTANADIRLIGPENTITFSSPNNAEPSVTFANNVNQPVVLNSNVIFPGPTFTADGSVSGSGRLSVSNSLTVGSTFTFGSTPLVLFVTAPGTIFQLNVNGAGSVLSINPSLISPLNFGPPSFDFNLATGTVCKVGLPDGQNSISFQDINVNTAGTLRFSSGSFNVNVLTVNSGTTFWLDQSFVSASVFALSSNNDGTQFSFFQYTVGNNLGANNITATNAVYRGAGIVSVVNTNWDGSAINVILTSNTAGGNNNLSPVTGSPGYVFTMAKASGSQNLQVSGVAIPSIVPIPTQSNGPAPPVNSGNAVVYSFTVLFALIAAFLLLN